MRGRTISYGCRTRGGLLRRQVTGVSLNEQGQKFVGEYNEGMDFAEGGKGEGTFPVGRRNSTSVSGDSSEENK